MRKKFKVFLTGINANHPLVEGVPIGYKFAFEALNFSLVNKDEERDAVVFIELDETELENLTDQTPIFLIRNEPIVVWPSNYKSKLLNRIDKIINVGKWDQDSNSLVVWPQYWPYMDEAKSFSSFRSNRIVLINGNKLSLVCGELYTLRRLAIANIPQLDLYGKDWDLTFARKIYTLAAEIYKAKKFGFPLHIAHIKLFFQKPDNYLGTTGSKMETLSKYKFSLVIENSDEYMTEKLFDSFFAGTIPIYVGPNIDQYDIPENLVIQVEANLEGIKSGIKRANSIDYGSWKNDLDIWLSDAEVQSRWSAEKVFPRIVNEIVNFLEDYKN